MKHRQINIAADDIEVGTLLEFPLTAPGREVRVRSIRAVGDGEASQTVALAHRVGSPSVLVECWAVNAPGHLGFTPGAYLAGDVSALLGSLDLAVGSASAPLVLYYIAHSGTPGDVRIDVVYEDRAV